METFNWALIGLSGSANLELALAGLELARSEVESEESANPPSGTVPQIEDDGSAVLKIRYESLPGSAWRSL